MSQDSVLKLSQVTKQFGSFRAVNNLSLDVKPHEIFGFLGPNGAGKTTTIRLILDVLRADRGEIRLFGKNSRNGNSLHRRIGYLSGEMALEADLTGGQYLGFLNHLYGGDHTSRMRELAQQLSLKLDVKIGQYSRGNRQKVGLVGALMHDPELLILDEPSSGFDPLVQETFIKLVNDYRVGGGTVFMSSHVLSEVQRLCDRVAFIKAGEIVGVKSIDELNHSTGKLVKIFAKPNILRNTKAQLEQLRGFVFQATHDNAIIGSYQGPVAALLRELASHQLDDVMIEEPDLEEVFLSYYDQKEKPA